MNQPPPDDPFAPSDATLLRPRPGRRPGSPQAGAFASSSPSATRLPPSGTAHEGGFGANLAEFLGSVSLNPLLQSAGPLLVLAGRLRSQIANADIEGLRRQCVQELRAFETRARRADTPPEDILAARYVLCTVLDEAVQNTPWGAQSSWASQSLLITFHKERDGGEKFFKILERVVTEPERYLALMELLYVCLAFGFEGRYRLSERGASKLVEVRQDLYRQIESMREGSESELSPRWKGVEDRRNATQRLVPIWVVAAGCAALLVGAYTYFDSKLSERSRELNGVLAGVGIERVVAAPVDKAVPPTGLATFLAPQITQHLVQVDEQGPRSLITIIAPDLFASGSARISSKYEDLVHDIGAALNRVPGRIVVTGHTDDQPVHSFSFHDNFELSKARALQVSDLLKRDILDASRIEAVGRGDSDPRYEPVNSPENRARNRRVEIVHRRDN